MDFGAFMATINTVLMGRGTFEVFLQQGEDGGMGEGLPVLPAGTEAIPLRLHSAESFPTGLVLAKNQVAR